MLVSNLRDATRARLRTLGGECSVREAAAAFSATHLGLLVVCTDAGEASGVVSKSDLVRHLARGSRNDAPLSEVMSRSVFSASESSDLRQTWQFMVRQQLQNLPLIDDGRRPIGMLDIRDALEAILRIEEQQENELINYIAGNGYR